jgi:hypothetical protein
VGVSSPDYADLKKAATPIGAYSATGEGLLFCGGCGCCFFVWVGVVVVVVGVRALCVLNQTKPPHPRKKTQKRLGDLGRGRPAVVRFWRARPVVGC